MYWQLDIACPRHIGLCIKKLHRICLKKIIVFIRPFEKTGRIMKWCLCPSVCLSVVLCLALVYVLYLKISSSARSMKLESQLHLGYCMKIYASDAGSHLYFSQNLLFSGLSGFYQH